MKKIIVTKNLKTKITPIGKIPSDWETVKLGKICEIRTGKKDVDEGNPNGKYPFFSCSREINYSDTYSFDTEAILIAGNGDVGNTRIYKGKFEAYQRTYVLNKFRNGDIHFLHYGILFGLKKKLLKDKSGSTMPYVKKGDLESFEIPLPSLPEQKKIVYVLDNIQKITRIQEKIIGKTKELKGSLMKKLFMEGMRGEKLKETEIGKMPMSWGVKELKEVVEKSVQINPKEWSNKRIKYIDVSSVSSETFKIVNSKEYYGKDAPSRARKKIKTNDIIFATVRPYLRRLALVPIEFDDEICSTAFCVIRADNKKGDPIFLFSYIMSNNFINRVTSLQTGANYPAVSDKEVFKQKIPIPLLKEQREIAEILQTVDQKIEIEQKKKSLYDELFKTMLNKLMTREIKTDNLKI